MNLAIFPAIPPETVKEARAIFGRSNFYLVIGDEVNSFFKGMSLADPSGNYLKTRRTIAMLFLITIFQFNETLPDQLAAFAMLERIDWKYALHLTINHPGIEVESFCEFRRWLMGEDTNLACFQILLERMSEKLDLPGRQSAYPNNLQVLANVCQFNRLAKLWEANIQAMQAIATNRPDWLLSISLPHWFERYGYPTRYPDLTVDDLEKQTIALSMGADGWHLQQAIENAGDFTLAGISEVKVLEKTWNDQFEWVEGKIMWRLNACAKCNFSNSSSQSILIANSTGGGIQATND